MVQTIANADGTVSIVHVDPNNPVITLPDGTQAQVHTLADNKQWKSDIKHRLLTSDIRNGQLTSDIRNGRLTSDIRLRQ